MKRPESVKKIQQVVHGIGPKIEAILYGSEARGDARSDSDFDLLILVDAEKVTPEMREQIENPLYDLWIDQGIDVSPLIYTRTQWENRPFLTPFYCNVMNEGIRL
ncbi:MAG: nucleotidyltransferase domain-containing protein [Bacteroidales bacterium]|nr:nucleotidyltransferase domain-containing protein [Bacteroidales bacterium]